MRKDDPASAILRIESRRIYYFNRGLVRKRHFR